MNKSLRRILVPMGIAVGVLLTVGAVLFFTVGRPGSLPPLPNPNGYDDLLKAGQTVTSNNDNPADLELDELRALVATNAEALRLLRVGLSRRCAVPTDAAIANFGSVSRDLMGLKSLARVLLAEGRLAEREDRPAAAARSYVDSIRLGTEMSRGGLMINRLVGITCEAMGTIPLVKLLPRLTCEQMQPLGKELEQIDDSTVSWGEVMGCENRFVRVQMSEYPNPIRLASDLWQARHLRRSSEQKHDSTAARLRLLTTELALRCYRCDQGSAPARLDQLVPKYLQQMPLDPFGGRPLVYRPDGTNWLLYSVGPDRVDDGGKPADRSKSDDFPIGLGGSQSGGGESRGDLRYDSPW